MTWHTHIIVLQHSTARSLSDKAQRDTNMTLQQGCTNTRRRVAVATKGRFTLAMPRPCHPRPCRSSQGHGTLQTACVLSPRVRLLPATTRSSTKVIRRRWPVWNQTPFVMDKEKSGSNTLQKRRSVELLDYQFGYFRLPWGLSRRTRQYQSRAGARHGMRELTHGMAWAPHAMCESALTFARWCLTFACPQCATSACQPSGDYRLKCVDLSCNLCNW
jgi:hypothetical protein